MKPVVIAPVVAILATHSACGQTVDDPFPSPLSENGGVIRVDFAEFASIPDVGGEPARMMQLVDERVSGRMFLNDQRGPLYTVSYNGLTVELYLDVDEPRWAVGVESGARERGVQSFALHPQFAQPGTPGFGKFYTWTDSNNTAPTPDFMPGGGGNTHDTVLLEWTAADPTATRYDGGGPRELMRFEQPFSNHNGGHIAFNLFVPLSHADFGLLYVGIADGGSGGDPLNHAQDLSSGFGKIFRIDPLGSGSANGQYGIPADNPFAGDSDPQTLDEIYAYGVRNPQRFAWDPQNNSLFLADIGQNIVEEVSLVTRGADLGWNVWEGSFRFIGRQAVDLENVRSDPSVTYPLAEYGQLDPLFSPRSAASGLVVYRGDEISQLADLVLFTDMPNGEIFYVDADDLPEGGQDPLRRVLLNDGGQARTVLELVREKNAEQGREPTTRVDLKLALGANGRIFLLTKHDGTVRVLVPGPGS